MSLAPASCLDRLLLSEIPAVLMYELFSSAQAKKRMADVLAKKWDMEFTTASVKEFIVEMLERRDTFELYQQHLDKIVRITFKDKTSIIVTYELVPGHDIILRLATIPNDNDCRILHAWPAFQIADLEEKEEVEEPHEEDYEEEDDDAYEKDEPTEFFIQIVQLKKKLPNYDNIKFATADELLCGTDTIPLSPPKNLSPQLFDRQFILGSLGHLFAAVMIATIVGIEIAYLFQLLPVHVLGSILRARHWLRISQVLISILFFPFILPILDIYARKFLSLSSWISLSPRERVLQVFREIYEHARKTHNLQTLEALQCITGIQIGDDYEVCNKVGQVAWSEPGSGIMVVSEGALFLKPILRMFILLNARLQWQRKHWQLQYKMPERLTYYKHMARDAWKASMNTQTIIFYPLYILVSAALFFANLSSQVGEWIWFQISNRSKKLLPPKSYIPLLFNKSYQRVWSDPKADFDAVPQQLQPLLKSVRTIVETLKNKQHILARYGIKNVRAIALTGTLKHHGDLFSDKKIMQLQTIQRARMIIVYEGTLNVYPLRLMELLGLSDQNIVGFLSDKPGIIVEFTHHAYFENVLSKYYDFFPQYLPLSGQNYLEKHLTDNLRQQGPISKAPASAHVLGRLLTGKLRPWTRLWANPWVAMGEKLVEKNVPSETWNEYIDSITHQRLSTKCIKLWLAIMKLKIVRIILKPVTIALIVFVVGLGLIAQFNDLLMFYMASRPLALRGLGLFTCFCFIHLLLMPDNTAVVHWRRFIGNYVDAGTGKAIARQLGSPEAGWEYVFLLYHGHSREEAYKMVCDKYAGLKSSTKKLPTTSGQYKHRNLHSIDMAA